MSGVITKTAPSEEPLTGNEARIYLKLDSDIETDLIISLIITARQFVEDYLGRALITQTLELGLDGMRDYEIPIFDGIRTGPDIYYKQRTIVMPKPPLREIVSVTTFNENSVGTVYNADQYYVDTMGTPGRIILKRGSTWPTPLRVGNGIVVEYKAGYGDRSAVPRGIKQAMLQYLTFLYENRGELGEKTPAAPNAVTSLLQPFKVMNFSSNPYYATGAYGFGA